jgi:hypothetical protein
VGWFRRRCPTAVRPGGGVERSPTLAALTRERGANHQLTPDEASAVGGELRAAYDAGCARGQPEFELLGSLRRLGDEAAQVHGRHYVDWVPTLDWLRHEHRDDEALALLTEIIPAAEREARIIGREPAPGYTERAAIIYRRRGDYPAEVAVIERWQAACPPQQRGAGATQDRLAWRLARARELLGGTR